MFRLAHLSDPHLAPLPRPRKRELASKRVIGYINWRRGRGRAHKADVLATLIADLQAQRPDHVALTGDLLNLALRSELPPALEWLETLGPPGWVSVVPGNHDTYVQGALGRLESVWDAYMTGDVLAALPGGPDSDDHDIAEADEAVFAGAPRFPYVRRRGDVALVGVSSGVPTAPFLATGKVGRRQRARLAALLHALGEEGLFRVVMVHHPPLPGTAKRLRRLTDGAKFMEVLREAGAELVLHGHNHTRMLAWGHTADDASEDDGAVGHGARAMPIVGVPSASALPDAKRGKPGAAYNLYEIDRGADGWTCRMRSRGVEPDGQVADQGEPVWLVGPKTSG